MKKIEEDLEEIKLSLNSLSTDVKKVIKQQGLLTWEWRSWNSRHGLRMSSYWSGSKHRSYPRDIETGIGVKTGGDEPPVESCKHWSGKLWSFLRVKNCPCTVTTLQHAIATLPRKNAKAPPAIVVRFVNQKHKTDLLRQFRQLRGSGVYLNEHLAKKNADIARQARILQKEKTSKQLGRETVKWW